jgi:hypothetical protein
MRPATHSRGVRGGNLPKAERSEYFLPELMRPATHYTGFWGFGAAVAVGFVRTSKNVYTIIRLDNRQDTQAYTTCVLKFAPINRTCPNSNSNNLTTRIRNHPKGQQAAGNHPIRESLPRAKGGPPQYYRGPRAVPTDHVPSYEYWQSGKNQSDRRD